MVRQVSALSILNKLVGARRRPQGPLAYPPLWFTYTTSLGHGANTGATQDPSRHPRPGQPARKRHRTHPCSPPSWRIRPRTRIRNGRPARVTILRPPAPGSFRARSSCRVTVRSDPPARQPKPALPVQRCRPRRFEHLGTEENPRPRGSIEGRAGAPGSTLATGLEGNRLLHRGSNSHILCWLVVSTPDAGSRRGARAGRWNQNPNDGVVARSRSSQ